MQTKLAIGPVDDAFEREADAVADRVMGVHQKREIGLSWSLPVVRRKCGCQGSGVPCDQCKEEENEPALRRKADGRTGPTEAPPEVHDVVREPGRTLDARTRAFFEPRFGFDFSHVRIHSDARAAESARSVKALAFTVGNHIVFGPGAFDPATHASSRLIAHELTHVVQQGGAGQARMVRRQPEKIPDLDRRYYESLAANDWSAAAEVLNAFSKEDIEARLRKLKRPMVIALYESAVKNPRLGPESQIAMLTRPAYLDLHYALAKSNEDWAEAAKFLNAFNADDIRKRLAELTPVQIAKLHAGALANPEVGDKSEIALLTSAAPPPSGGAAAGPPPASTIDIPYEKSAPEIEASYRRLGLTEEADAVARCRKGYCSKILTESEAYAAFHAARSKAGIDDPTTALTVLSEKTVESKLKAELEAKAAAEAAAKAEAETAAEAVAETETVAETGAPVAGAGAFIVIPIALGVNIVLGVHDLWGYGEFQAAAHKQGFVILPNPLQTCVTGCHSPASPLSETAHLDLSKTKFPKPDVEMFKQWVKAEPGSPPAVTPQPAPGKKEKEKKKDCEIKRRTKPSGEDPLSDLFCEIAGGSGSYDILSTHGRAEIDALLGNVWMECKCGQLRMVRAYLQGKAWARAKLEGSAKRPHGIDEQVRRHKRIADHCGLKYQLVVANSEVEAFFRNRYTDIDVRRVGWEPCE